MMRGPVPVPRIRGFLALGLLLGLACYGGDGGELRIVTPPGGDAVELRFLHASPGGSNLELAANGLATLGPIGFGQVTRYTSLGATQLTLTLRRSGVALPVLDTVVTVATGTILTVIADGDSGALRLRLLNDATPTTDTSFIQLRVLDEASAPGPLDVFVSDPVTALDSLAPVITGIGYRTASQYLALPPGTYRVRFTLAGTRTLVLDTGNLALGNGDIRTVVVLDAAGGGLPPSVVVLEDGATD